MKKIFLVFLTLACAQVFAQEQKEEPKKKSIEELRLNLNDDGTHYIKATFLNQTWFRYADYNPGTTIISTSFLVREELLTILTHHIQTEKISSLFTMR